MNVANAWGQQICANCSLDRLSELSTHGDTQPCILPEYDIFMLPDQGWLRCL